MYSDLCNKLEKLKIKKNSVCLFCCAFKTQLPYSKKTTFYVHHILRFKSIAGTNCYFLGAVLIKFILSSNVWGTWIKLRIPLKYKHWQRTKYNNILNTTDVEKKMWNLLGSNLTLYSCFHQLTISISITDSWIKHQQVRQLLFVHKATRPGLSWEKKHVTVQSAVCESDPPKEKTNSNLRCYWFS